MHVIRNSSAMNAPCQEGKRHYTSLIRGSAGLSKSSLYLFIIGTVFLMAKIVLISSDEIIFLSSVHDDVWQIYASKRFYWFANSYQPDHFYHLPIYPIWIEMVRWTGIPLRVVTEVFYSISCMFLVFALRKEIPNLVAIAITILVLFWPTPIILQNQCIPEILLAPLVMAACACSLLWWQNRKLANGWRWSIASGAVWALAWLTRKESFHFLLFFLVLASCLIVSDRESGRRPLFFRFIIGVIIPLTCIGFGSTVLKTINFLKWGAFATSIVETPGFRSAYHALQEIKVEKNYDYIPVSYEARRKAYEVSPAFRELESSLEGDVGSYWSRFTWDKKDGMGISGLHHNEIAAGWFYWALHSSAVAAGEGQNPGQENEFFNRVAGEINSAFLNKRLERRWVPVTFLDPDLGRWIRRLPTSLIRVFSVFYGDRHTLRPIEDSRMIGEAPSLLDRQANRRSHLLLNGRVILRGVVLDEKRRDINHLSLVNQRGAVIARSSSIFVRSHIEGGLRCGFEIDAPVGDPETWRKSSVLIALDDGETLEIPSKSLKSGKWLEILGPAGRGGLFLDRLEFNYPMAWEIQGWLGKVIQKLLMGFFWSWIFLLPIVIIAWFWGISKFSLTPLLLLGSLWFGRIVLFSILDASAWPAAQRYMLPVMPLYFITILVFAWHGIVALFMVSMKFVYR